MYAFILSGERKSAYLAQEWPDLDLDQAIAYITATLKEALRRAPGGVKLKPEFNARVSGRSKLHTTDKSYPWTHSAALLERQRNRITTNRLKTGGVHCCTAAPPMKCHEPGYHDRDLVWCNDDGDYYEPKAFTKTFKDVIRSYNAAHPDDPLPIVHVHSLRFTWSTLAESLGINATTRMAVMDQRSLRTNQRYTNEVPEDIIQAHESVSSRLLGEVFGNVDWHHTSPPRRRSE